VLPESLAEGKQLAEPSQGTRTRANGPGSQPWPGASAPPPRSVRARFAPETTRERNRANTGRRSLHKKKIRDAQSNKGRMWVSHAAFVLVVNWPLPAL